MNENKKEKSDWIRLASKSRPGRFYLFNKATGETQWLPLKQEDSVQLERGPTLPKLSIKKVSKTPAQDRLKRLQHNLKVDQTKKPTSSSAHHGPIFSIKASREQEIVLDEQPTSSSISQNFKKSRKKARKRTQSVISSNETDNNSHSSIIDNPKKLRVSDSLKCDLTNAATSNESSSLKNSGEISQSTKHPSINIPKNSQNGSSKLENLRSGIVKTIQKICKIPYNVSKILTADKLLTQNENSSNLKNIKKSKATTKTNFRKILSKSDTPEVAINQIKAENQFLKKASDSNLPKNLKYPSYPQGSANSRLDRLRQSLLSQNHGKQEPSNDRNNSDSKCQSSNRNESNRHETSSLQIGDTHITDNNSTTPAYSSDNVTHSDEAEAMDWQPILMTESSIEEVISEPTLIVEKSKRLLLKKIDANKNQTMGDIIDTVNENLLRFAAEKEKASNNNNEKWRKDFYYFVVDTNVLLRDITFLEDLSKVKLCGTKGSMLYIPYSVLQELDKLKMRSGASEGVKTLAVRAIKYLNSKFENNSHHLQAQSALDEQRHLIDVNSADDSIINCCLQVMEHVVQLLLLTEDINLRNKAICNNITVSTKSDLMTKRYEKSNKS